MTINLDKWWLNVRASDRATRLAREESERNITEYPARYGTSTGEPTPHPWSACIGSINRLQKILDMNVTAASLRKALGI